MGPKVEAAAAASSPAAARARHHRLDQITDAVEGGFGTVIEAD